MAIDEPSPEQSRRVRFREKTAFLFDYALVVGGLATITGAVSRTAGWSPFLHLLLPALTVPFLRYFHYRLFGATPGQYVAGIETRAAGGERATRLYDWLFSLRPRRAAKPPGRADIFVAIMAGIIFTVGSNFFLWMRDPTLRPFPSAVVPLFAPDRASAPDWQVLPFFYATGAFPIRVKTASAIPSKETNAELSVEFSLPYEKGPPARFLGKITAYWRDLDSRLTLTGPLSVASPSSPAELRRCFGAWFRCPVDRRKIWKNSIAPQLAGLALAENAWFIVENPLLPEDERPQGIYLRTQADRGRIREAYFLVGPKMAVQALILDRPDRAEGELAGVALRKIVGSLRLMGDLQASRAFINPKLASLRIDAKSSLAELVAAESHLFAKVSIEPKEVESFYHLGGLALTLYHAAKREGRIELAASSKTIVKSALRFARDVDAKSKRIAELEKFEAEVEAR